MIPNMIDPEGRERDSIIKISRRIQEIKREERGKKELGVIYIHVCWGCPCAH